MIKLKILLLDDNQGVRDELSEFLTSKNFEIFQASLPSEATLILENNEIDIAIVDVKLPEKDGITYLKEIKESYPFLEVIMITGHGDMNMVIQALRSGANDFFQKPFRSIDVEGAIHRTQRFIELNKKLKTAETNYSLLTQELNSKFRWNLIAESAAMKSVLDLVAKVALSDKTTVLITGESGTGKELIARMIHYLSARKNNYFNAVNCSAIPDTLFESEFFGHKRGAFTDAVETKSGMFEVTNKGTLFLDEIGDLKYDLQGKFLRVLEEGRVSKIGDNKEFDIDVRVVAATNRDLKQMCDESRFRIDLLHRLNSFVIHIPPLRERKEAIPALIEYYLKEFAKQARKKIKGIDANTLRLLQNYEFPGNIRELRNMIERAVIICDDDRLQMKHFQLEADLIIPVTELYEDNESYNLAEIERSVIIKALTRTKNNRTHASNLLGIERSRLLRKINLYSITEKDIKKGKTNKNG